MPVAAPVAVMDDILLPRFLQKGGAAGALLRAMDWTRHPLGPPETWPVILQTTVGIVLGSRQPMFVAWGQDYLTIYNDGFAQICPDRHPASLGGKLEDMWYDIWDKVGPMCESVFAGESIHLDDFQVLLHRNCRLEEAHFSFSYTPLQNERAEVLGLFCACAETTEQVFLRRELDHERTRLAQIFEHSRSFIAKTSGPDHVFELVNPAYMQLIGHRDIIGKSICDALPEVASQGYIALRNEIFATGESKRIDGLKVALRRVPGSAPEDRYLDFVYQPVLNSADAVTGIFVEGVDVTDRTEALADRKSVV